VEIVEFTVAEVGDSLAALLSCLDSHGVEVTGEATEIAGVKVGDILEIRGDRDRVLERLERCNPDWNVYLRPYG
jgi:hypothetical protein